MTSPTAIEIAEKLENEVAVGGLNFPGEATLSIDQARSISRLLRSGQAMREALEKCAMVPCQHYCDEDDVCGPCAAENALAAAREAGWV